MSRASRGALRRDWRRPGRCGWHHRVECRSLPCTRPCRVSEEAGRARVARPAAILPKRRHGNPRGGRAIRRISRGDAKDAKENRFGSSRPLHAAARATFFIEIRQRVTPGITGPAMTGDRHLPVPVGTCPGQALRFGSSVLRFFGPGTAVRAVSAALSTPGLEPPSTSLPRRRSGISRWRRCAPRAAGRAAAGCRGRRGCRRTRRGPPISGSACAGRRTA